MRAEVNISIGDYEVTSLSPSLSTGVESCKIFFGDDRGSSIELERRTLERMIACMDADQRFRRLRGVR